MIQDHSVQHRGRSIAVRSVGVAEGRSVLVLHGAPNSRLVLPDEATAKRAGVRVLSFDRPGYGGSAPDPSPSWADAGDEVNEVLDAVGVTEGCTVIGWSAGAGHALAAASRPETRVGAVALVAPVGPVDVAACRTAMSEGASRQLAMLRRLPRPLRRQVVRLALGPTARRAAAEPEVRWRALFERACAVDRSVMERPAVSEVLRADIVESFAQRGAGWFRDAVLMAQPSEDLVRAVSQPVTIWHGEEDDEVGIESSRALAALLPDGALQPVPGAGHYVLFDLWPDLLRVR